MTFEFLPSVEVRDVTLRDGLQLTGKLLSVERKVSIIRELLDIGVPFLEIGSLARPDLVPPLANTLEVIGELTSEELTRCWVWVATPRHVQRAADAGATNFQYCFSASESHNRANLGRTVDTSLDGMQEAISIANGVGGEVQLCIATSFTCPFEGPVPEDRVIAIANDPRTKGSAEIVVCDTLGQAVPAQVSNLISRVKAESPARRTAYHGHDTWGLGVANALAAVEAGATSIDGALGGLGGCPFAPGASGNTATEDLLFATRPAWLDPATLARIVATTEGLLRDLEEPLRAKTVEGARANAVAFEWTIASTA